MAKFFPLGPSNTPAEADANKTAMRTLWTKTLVTQAAQNRKTKTNKQPNTTAQGYGETTHSMVDASSSGDMADSRRNSG
jgi:hypothetical protein